MQKVSGSFLVLIQYDVAETISLDALRLRLGTGAPAREPKFTHPAPGYVRFEKFPVVEELEPVAISTGERFQCRLKYFDYGVVSVELELPFTADFDRMVRLSSRWTSATEIETCTANLVKERVERFKAVRGIFVQPYPAFLSEEYYVVRLNQALDDDGHPRSAANLLSNFGDGIAQIVRGEHQTLAPSERNEALQSSMSYYPNDLLVVGWVAALVYDAYDGAASTIQLLEYANTQLLEFRHYDEVLSHVLDTAYQLLEHRGGLLRNWKMARQAERLNTIRLDITELTERTDNSIKFLSDMFYARAYKMAARRVGVTDYRNLVEEKLRTAGELYQFMVNEFHQARAFILELMVVAILVIELVHLFRGNR
jgi:hypothetical protein